MATRKTRPARRSATARRSAPSRGPAGGRSTGSSARRRTARYVPRRRRPALSTTLGTALGALAVSSLLNASWAVRIGIVALVLVVGLAYLLWRHRAEISAAPPEPAAPAASSSAVAQPSATDPDTSPSSSNEPSAEGDPSS